MTTTFKLARQMRVLNTMRIRKAPSPRKRAEETDAMFDMRKANELDRHERYRARKETESAALARSIHNAPEHKRRIAQVRA